MRYLKKFIFSRQKATEPEEADAENYSKIKTKLSSKDQTKSRTGSKKFRRRNFLATGRKLLRANEF